MDTGQVRMQVTVCNRSLGKGSLSGRSDRASRRRAVSCYGRDSADLRTLMSRKFEGRRFFNPAGPTGCGSYQRAFAVTTSEPPFHVYSVKRTIAVLNARK